MYAECFERMLREQEIVMHLIIIDVNVLYVCLLLLGVATLPAPVVVPGVPGGVPGTAVGPTTTRKLCV